MKDFRSIAINMVKRGIYVVPTYKGLRHPALPDWPNLATNDAIRVENWAKNYPEDSNVCCVAKYTSGPILDIDDLDAAKKRGMPALPETLTVNTPGGGLHVYCASNPETMALGASLSVKEGGEKIVELKVHNAAVCAPNCTRSDGGVYTIIKDLPLAPLSKEFVAWLIANSSSKSASGKGSGRKLHPDFDPTELFEHYGWELADQFSKNGADYHVFGSCPIKGDSHEDGVRSKKTCLIIGNTVGFDCKVCDSYGWQALLEYMREQGYEDYPHPIYADEDEEIVTDKIQGNGPTEFTATPEEKGITAEIDRIMQLPSHPPKGGGDFADARQKSRRICMTILEHLHKTGRLFNCGNVTTYVDHKTRELIEIVRGGKKFQKLLISYGVFPGDKLCDDIGMFLGAYAVNAPNNTIYTMSFYDREKHLLYVNEYAGRFLRIDGQGKVVRLRNGDDGMLFTDGVAGQCTPLEADVDAVNRKLLQHDGILSADEFQAVLNANRLYPDSSSLITKHILDTIIYAEDGVGQENAHIILTLAILALFFHERIRSNPFIYLYGAGASMKSSLALKVGKLLQGPKFGVTPATDDVDDLKIMAMNNPFLVLDEANNVKRLENTLKSIATGAVDKRRELYTTATERVTSYQARIWMTANTASLTNETLSARLMIIDAGSRTEKEPYRSEFYLEWSSELRNQIWTELVDRLSCVMQELTEADTLGEGDLAVSHRMSSFFVFGRTLARREGWEDHFMNAMNAMGARQMGASAEGNDILDLIQKLPTSHNGTVRTAAEWAGIFPQVVPEANRELRQKCGQQGWVRHQFTANQHLLKGHCGMKVHTKSTPAKNRINTYSFTGCAGEGSGVCG